MNSELDCKYIKYLGLIKQLKTRCYLVYFQFLLIHINFTQMMYYWLSVSEILCRARVIIMVEQNSLSFNRTFFEPCFTAKTGYKYVKFVAQIGYSIPFNSNDIIEYQPFMFSVGLHFTINKKYN